MSDGFAVGVAVGKLAALAAVLVFVAWRVRSWWKSKHVKETR